LQDKGYGGYSRSHRKSNDVMHGSEAKVEVFVEGNQVSAASDSSANDTVAEQEEKVQSHRQNDVVSRSERFYKGDDMVKQQVLAMSADDIAEHPLVMKMMQRLAALEGRDSVTGEQSDDACMRQKSYARGVGKDDNGRGHNNSKEVEVSVSICEMFVNSFYEKF